MALVNAFTTPLTADAYCDLAEMNADLRWNKQWGLLIDSDKEDLIKSVTSFLDSLLWKGRKAADANALEFPRSFGSSSGESHFSAVTQRKIMRSMVRAQIDWNFNRMGLGVDRYSLADESISSVGWTLCDAAKLAAWEYLDA